MPSLNRTNDEIVIRIIGLLTTVNVPIYPHVRPAKNAPDKFIVINGFCTIPGKMQKFVINVNCHSRNIGGNIDRVALNEMSLAVLSILEEYDAPNDLIVEFDAQEAFQEPNADEHFSNLRFIVKSINN